MPIRSPSSPACVLVTGATGFLGKVVVETLLRGGALGTDVRVVVVVRRKRGRTAAERFATMLASPCFAGLPPGWQAQVDMVEGNLAAEGCGLTSDDRARLREQLTHVIHCAAAVDFDLPLKVACESNVTSSLNVLALAAACRRRVRMVSVSTAYVMPHRTGPLPEVLAPLPVPATELLAQIQAGGARKEEMLARTGHPNTYTLTKCIAEHLLCERRGEVDLQIVRPSIIAAAWQHPTPGWIDSPAALAGFVAAIGGGLMHVVDARGEIHLDVVPVDVVAARTVAAAAEPLAPAGTRPADPVRLVTAGFADSARIDTWIAAIVGHFRRYPMGRRAAVHHLGPRNWRFFARRLAHHRLPAALAQAVYRLRGRRDLARGIHRGLQRLDAINRVFPYFTNQTFDFRARTGMPAGFDVEAYVPLCCQGVMQHLMGGDAAQVRLGGAKTEPRRSELLWALTRPRGNWAVRLSSAVFARALRRLCDEVSFDQASFEAARAAAGPDAQVVFVPTHRSYMDFLLCSFLFFARPDLGLGIPHIAAAEEFSRIQVLGWLFRQMHAFYLRRNAGREDPELTAKVHALVARREPLQFFIEGQRSRSRQFLTPRRGLLRCLQNTGQRFVLVPIAICYDRVPEEAALLRELAGYPKDRMRLAPLLAWSRRMRRGEVALGRVHLAAGRPCVLAPETDVHALSRQVMGELQRTMATTTYHLRAFLAAHPGLPIDLAWLRAAVVARGGTVLESELQAPTPPEADGLMIRTLAHQWAHLFLPEACAAQPDNPALRHFCDENLFAAVTPPAQDAADARRVAALATALFAPVVADYVAVARALLPHVGRRQRLVRDQILERAACGDRAVASAALRALVAREVISVVDPGHLQAHGRSAALADFIGRSAWAPADLAAFVPRLVTA